MNEATAVGGRWHLGSRVIGPFRRAVIAGLVKEHGFSQAEAEDVVGKIGDGTIINWIITHGPEIMAFIQMIIALFPK